MCQGSRMFIYLIIHRECTKLDQNSTNITGDVNYAAVYITTGLNFAHSQ